MAESDGPSPSIVPRVAPPLGSHFEFDRELGRGGAASVYLARDTRSAKLVAVKLLRPEFASAVGARRFLQEIALMAEFIHRDIKPENLLFVDDHVCVADFGIAYAI